MGEISTFNQIVSLCIAFDISIVVEVTALVWGFLMVVKFIFE